VVLVRKLEHTAEVEGVHKMEGGKLLREFLRRAAKQADSLGRRRLAVVAAAAHHNYWAADTRRAVAQKPRLLGVFPVEEKRQVAWALRVGKPVCHNLGKK
jgi:hypothetical protein